ncbi:MAG: hypothetical protein MUE61_21800, partial [Vicinamibacterales bacterium]|nr:hypothetical protein [Vicinamibacterales bacterium]
MTTRKRTTSPGTGRTGKTTATAATPDCSPNPPAGSERKSGRSGELSVAVEGADLEGSTWDQQVCRTLIDELWSIREGMLR